MFDSYIKKINDIDFYDIVNKTPLDKMGLLSRRACNNILLKREDLQSIFSFKIRGAYNKMLHLSETQKKRGVITASAGNHAQGVACAAKKLGIRCTIVMPRTTPQIKVNSVCALGGKILLWGDSYNEAAEQVKKIAAEKNLVYIPPFDDPDVIAGQGTVAKEILEQHRGQIDAIYIPVGGGGLCAGMLAYFKHYSPKTKVYAVESVDSACLQAAIEAGRRVSLKLPGIFADGVAVSQIGKHSFSIIKPLIDGVITVSNDEVCAAIKDIFEDTRAIAEPSGALALAGLKKHVSDNDQHCQTLIAVNSGANMNFDRLRYIIERANIGEQLETVLAVVIPEKPGSFKRFCLALGRRDITEFNYRFNDNKDASKGAVVFVGVSIDNHDDKTQLIDELEKKNYLVTDITDNETAKLHIRHMVGGNTHIDMERIFRFQFPERPGALGSFLTHLGSRWNISLFHYRNQGAAEGRVLVGLQVPDFELGEATQLFTDLNYSFHQEVDNPAINLFLSGESHQH